MKMKIALFSFLLTLLLPLEILAQQYGDGRYHLEKFYKTQTHVPINPKDLDWMPFKKDDLYGFVEKGNPDKWLVPATYERVYAVYKEVAIVGDESNFGVVDKKGKLIIPIYFDFLEKVGDIYHGMNFHAREKESDEHFSVILNLYIDSKGEELFREYAKTQKSFTAVDTLACFRKDNEVHIRGMSGRLWKSFKVEKEGEARKEFIGIENNLLLYREDLDSIFIYSGIDVHGKEIFNVNYNHFLKNVVQINPYLFMHERDYSYYFFNEKGQEKDFSYNPKTFQWKRYHDMFYLPYYSLTKKSTRKMGLINRAGKQLLDFEYDYVDEVLDENVFCVEKESVNSNYGSGRVHGPGQILSTKGKVVVDSIWCGYDLVERFKALGLPVAFYDNLLFNVKSGDIGYDYYGDFQMIEHSDAKLHFYYYDKKGQTQIELTPDIVYAGMFSEGLAYVVDANGALGFINLKGELVIDHKYEIAKNPTYLTPYYSTPVFKDGFAYVQPYNAYIDKDGTEYFSYTDKYDLPGGPSSQWMEIRREWTDNLIGDRFICLDMTITNKGTIKIGHYNSPGSKYVNGKFEIRDSLLLLNPQDEDGSRLRYVVDHQEFLIEKMDKDSLILRTVYPSKARQNRRFIFIPKANFDQYSLTEIRSQFAFPLKDSLAVDQLRKDAEMKRALRKKDRKSPTFPGGVEVMKKYITDNLIYPENHTELKLITAYFDVDKDGQLLNIKLRNKTESAYTKEALRLIKAMPKWLPATDLGKPRLQHYRLNILFEAAKE